jgi:hypothetical protein
VKIENVVTELEQVAKRLGVRVSYEAIGGELGAGGLCKVKGEWRAIIDRRTTPGERAGMLAQALQRFPWEDQELSQPARDMLERARARPGRPASGPGPGQPAT